MSYFFLHANEQHYNVTFLITLKAAADAKYYGNVEVYNMLRAKGANAPVLIFPLSK